MRWSFRSVPHEWHDLHVSLRRAELNSCSCFLLLLSLLWNRGSPPVFSSHVLEKKQETCITFCWPLLSWHSCTSQVKYTTETPLDWLCFSHLLNTSRCKSGDECTVGTAWDVEQVNFTFKCLFIKIAELYFAHYSYSRCVVFPCHLWVKEEVS